MKKFFTLGLSFMLIGAILLAGGLIGSAINDISYTIDDTVKLNGSAILGTTIGLAFLTVGGIMLIVYAALIIKQNYDKKKEIETKEKSMTAETKISKVQANEKVIVSEEKMVKEIKAPAAKKTKSTK